MINKIFFTLFIFDIFYLILCYEGKVLPSYLRWNKIVTNDWNQNVNFPNYYPRVLFNGWDGRESSRRQLSNEIFWSAKDKARYASGDNVVNRALIQTWTPTCLHDLIYCLLQQGVLKRNH